MAVRYSNGRIVGLRLALFDELFLPLLAFNVVVFAGLILAVRYWATSPALVEPELLIWLGMLGLGVLISVVLDIHIVRACWMALRRPLR